MAQENKTDLVPCSQCGAPVLTNLAECMFCGQKDPGKLASNPVGKQVVNMRQRARKARQSAQQRRNSAEFDETVSKVSGWFQGEAMVTNTISAVAIGLYILTMIIDLGGVTLLSIFNFLAPSPLGILTMRNISGNIPVLNQVVPMFTSIFLHSNLIHIGIILLIFARIGRSAENLYGREKMFIIFAVGALLGSAVSWMVGGGVPIGVSGGMFATLAGLVHFGRNRGDWWGEEIARQYMVMALVLIAFSLFFGSGDLWSEAGGFLGGLFVAHLIHLNNWRLDQRFYDIVTRTLIGLFVAAYAIAIVL